MDNDAHVADVLRQRDRDRYLADLYAPEEPRKALFALHAFGAEIGRIRDVVSEPALGEIRLQWWRDALAAGDAAGHPIAAAVIDAVRRWDLPLGALDRMIAARVFDLYDDPMPTLADLEGYAGETASALLQLSALVLAPDRPETADASGHGGVAETMAGLLRLVASDPQRAATFVPDEILDAHNADRSDIAARESTPPVLAAIAAVRGLARHHLERAKTALAVLPRQVLPAYLPLAVTAARLDRMERARANPFLAAEPSALRRQWAIWRAARSGLAPAP